MKYKMAFELDIRHPTIPECELVQGFVQTVVDMEYGGLWARPPLPIGNTDWSPAWVILFHDAIAGVVLTTQDWIEDLWVLANVRGAGVGSELLAKGESEIAARGYMDAHLRVVSSNLKAIRFYTGRRWALNREYPHEKFPVTMTEMRKPLRC
jgi:ribosomal protein S18 acetylase RimI-like enzyme